MKYGLYKINDQSIVNLDDVSTVRLSGNVIEFGFKNVNIIKFSFNNADSAKLKFNNICEFIDEK